MPVVNIDCLSVNNLRKIIYSASVYIYTRVLSLFEEYDALLLKSIVSA